MVDREVALLGGQVLDVETGELARADLGVAGGRVVRPRDLRDPERVDVSGLTVSFGLWDCHAHPGSLMYDPPGTGYFESVAARTVRAGSHLLEAVRMGVTGVRALGEAAGIDLAWSKAYASGAAAGPRLVCASTCVRTTGGHGTAWPRRYVDMEHELVADGPTGMRRAVRLLGERGATWVKVLLTGGLYSEHETVDGGQLSQDELEAVMTTARERGLKVAAHCGSARWAERFAAAGGRSVEHGYALDEAAAKAMADAGTWLVPTIGVTHDTEMMAADGWPPHAAERAVETAPGHEEALRACVEAGVQLATGADLNPIGPRLHAELRLLEGAGLSRQQVLFAATAGGRRLTGLGDETAPVPGAAADLLLLEGNPLDDLGVLRQPRGVLTFGRFAVRPGAA